jgi:hypothetical protein
MWTSIVSAIGGLNRSKSKDQRSKAKAESTKIEVQSPKAKLPSRMWRTATGQPLSGRIALIELSGFNHPITTLFVRD